MGEALSIAISLDTPVYDALFIAKAHVDHATRVTADRHQAFFVQKIRCNGDPGLSIPGDCFFPTDILSIFENFPFFQLR
jgi:hypothetical protein